MKRRGGFTLIETLIYLGLLGVVGGAVLSVERAVRRSTASETGSLISLDDQRRCAEQFQRDVEGAIEGRTLDGVRQLELKIPASQDGKPVPGKVDTVVWMRDPNRPNLLVRTSDSPFKKSDASRILSHACDGVRFEINGRTITAEITFGTWDGAALIGRHALTSVAVRRVTEGEKE